MGNPLVPIVNGLGQGSLLFLVALGLTLTLGVMRFLNIANGAFYMLGAYFTFLLLGGGHVTALLLVGAILLAGVLTGVVGGASEYLFIRRLYPLPHLFPLVGTYAVLLSLQGVAILVWGVTPRATAQADAFTGHVAVGGSSFSVYNLLVIAVGLLAVIAVGLVLARTRFGRMVRATADDRDMAAILGINTKRVFFLMFTLSTLLAGIAGGFTSPLIGLTPDIASTFVIEAFAVVIVGGIGSVMGTYVASLGLGVLQSILVSVRPSLAEVSIYIAMGIVMLVRPQGLFGRRQVGVV